MAQWFHNLRLIRRFPGSVPTVEGLWFVDPAAPDHLGKLDRARKILAASRAADPEATWELETRGESGVWHKMEDTDVVRPQL